MAPPPDVDAELEELLAQQARFLSGNEVPAARVRRRAAEPAAAAASASAAAAAPQPPPRAARDAAVRVDAAAMPAAGGDAAEDTLAAGFAALSRGGSAGLRGQAAAGAAADLSDLDELPAAPAATAVRMPRRGTPSPAAAADSVAAAAVPPAARPRGPPPPPAPGGPMDAPKILGAVLERDTGAPAAPVAPTAPSRSAAFPAPRNRFAPPQPPAAPAPVPSSASAAPLSGNGDDASGRAAEAAARLANMTAEQIAEAQAELAARLPANKLAFLKARGMRGQGAAAPPPPAPVPAASRSTAFAAPCAPLPPLPAPAAARPAAPASGAGAVRFGLDGSLLPPAASPATSADPSPASALQRDPLRTEGDPSAQGYTLREAAHLARSAVPAQRCAALRLLTGALKRIAAAMAAPPATSADAPGPGVSWAALWVHGVKEAQLPLLLRTALDDAAPAVAAAAAGAIAALVAAPADAAGWEAACDATWLDDDVAPPGAPHWRPRAHAAWEPVAPAEEGEEGEADNDAVDPMTALLRMGFTQRARFLLEAARNGAAAAPLLRTLLAAARHGAQAAEGVAATPRLLATLREVFLEAPPPAAAGRRAGVGGAEDAAEAEYWAARPLALRVLRALARASPAAAAAIAKEGTVAAAAARFAPLPAAAPTKTEGAAEAAEAALASAADAAALRREALRLWRAAAAAGAPVPSVPSADALFPVLCAALHPPADVAADVAAWEASRDVLALMGTLAIRAAASPDDVSVMSPGVAAAVAAAAAAWVAPAALHTLRAASEGGGAAAAALGALAAAVRYLAEAAPAATAVAAAAQLAAHVLAAEDASAPAARLAADTSLLGGVLRTLSVSVATAEDADDVAAADVAAAPQCVLARWCALAAAPTASPADARAAAALATARATLALLRRAAAARSQRDAATAADAAAAAASAAASAAACMLTQLTPAVAALAAAEEEKDAWQAGPVRARAGALCAALSEALCALSELRSRGPTAATTAVPSPLAQANAALLLAAAAPPGAEALVAAALAAAVTAADAALALLPAAAALAAAAARVAGSASAAEADAEAEGAAAEGRVSAAWAALAAAPPSVPPAMRAALRGRLCAAADVPTAAPTRRRRGAGGVAAAEGSRLPLPRDWPLRALSQPPSAPELIAISAAAGADGIAPARAAGSDDAALAGPLALVLALEGGGDSCRSLLADVAPATKLRLLGAAFAAAPEGVLRDAATRRLLAALTDRYSAALRDAAAADADVVAAAAAERYDDEDVRAAAEAATMLCETFADASFGDPLHARHAALCLRSGAPPGARAAALRALLERGATHLLPPLEAFAFPAGVRAEAACALFTPAAGEASAEALTLYADLACTPREFERAAAARALPATLAMHALQGCAALLRAAPPRGTEHNTAAQRRADAAEALLRRVARNGAAEPAALAKEALASAGRAAAE